VRVKLYGRVSSNHNIYNGDGIGLAIIILNISMKAPKMLNRSKISSVECQFEASYCSKLQSTKLFLLSSALVYRLSQTAELNLQNLTVNTKKGKFIPSIGLGLYIPTALVNFCQQEKLSQMRFSAMHQTRS
jgi:hypothetical protein